jgi:hypothetical protein
MSRGTGRIEDSSPRLADSRNCLSLVVIFSFLGKMRFVTMQPHSKICEVLNLNACVTRFVWTIQKPLLVPPNGEVNRIACFCVVSVQLMRALSCFHKSKFSFAESHAINFCG